MSEDLKKFSSIIRNLTDKYVKMCKNYTTMSQALKAPCSNLRCVRNPQISWQIISNFYFFAKSEIVCLFFVVILIHMALNLKEKKKCSSSLSDLIKETLLRDEREEQSPASGTN